MLWGRLKGWLHRQWGTRLNIPWLTTIVSPSMVPLLFHPSFLVKYRYRLCKSLISECLEKKDQRALYWLCGGSWRCVITCMTLFVRTRKRMRWRYRLGSSLGCDGLAVVVAGTRTLSLSFSGSITVLVWWTIVAMAPSDQMRSVSLLPSQFSVWRIF